MPTPEKKGSLLADTVAAIGFFAVITVALWGAGNMLQLAPTMFSALVSPSSSTTIATKTATSTVAKYSSPTPAAIVAAQREQAAATRHVDFSRYTATTTLVQKKSAPVASKPKTPAKKTLAVNTGRPDLSVSIVATGMIDPITDTFVERTPILSSDIGAVRFMVRNVGTAPSGSWRFSASLPVSTDEDSYTSTLQPSISSGGHITYTLRFNNTIQGAPFSVHADPSGRLHETRTSNNTASVTF